MLQRLYVDNYKSLVNFEFAPQRVQLLLGENGSGKSSVFDVLAILRDFVAGEGKTGELFPGPTRTRWDRRTVQSFEIQVSGNRGLYEYKLQIDHQDEIKKNRVVEEVLFFDGRPLFEFKLGNVQLYRDNFTQGPPFKFDWTQSGLGVIGSRQDNQRLTWFKDWLAGVQVLRIDPFHVAATSEQEEEQLERDMRNFASWYRDRKLTGPEQMVSGLHESLKEVWEGFESLKFDKAGPDVLVLKAVVKSHANGDDGIGRASCEYGLDELSDGQRCLIALYALLQSLVGSPSGLLCIDEPDNFVALKEIQPWIASVCELAEEKDFQLLLISHHPELTDYLAPEHAVILKRTNGGPTRVLPFSTQAETALTPSEVMARGWDDE